MEFRLLGPLEVVREDDAAVALGGRRPRALLARLLLSPNEVVLGGSTRRRRLGRAAAREPRQARSTSTCTPCAARWGPTGSRRARPATGSASSRTSSTSSAFTPSSRVETPPRWPRRSSLWRGPALADLADEAFARADAARLDDARLAALEARIDADLEAGGTTR